MGTTALFSAVDDARLRFPQHLSELETFLNQHALPDEVEEAFRSLAERVEVTSEFRDDFASMLAVVLYGEPSLTQLELLGLVLAAASGGAGGETLATDPRLEEPARKLFQFVREARRRLHGGGSVFQEDSEIAGEESVPGEQVGLEEDPELQFEALPVAARSSADSQSALARALALAAEDVVLTGRAARREWTGQAEMPMPVATLAPEPPKAGPWRTWGVGALGVLLGLLLGVFLRSRPEAHPEPLPSAASSPSQRTATDPLAREHIAHRRLGAEMEAAFSRATGRHLHAPKARPAEQVPAHSGSGRNTTALAEAPAPLPAANSRTRTPAPSAAGPDRKGPAQPRSPVARIVRLQPVPAATTPDTLPSNRLRTGHVVLGSAGIMAANLVSSPAPAYPVQASAAQVQGEVVIEAVVGREGDVIDTRVVSGPVMLRDAALRAVQQWRYRPYEVDGKAAEIATTARVEFKLDGN